MTSMYVCVSALCDCPSPQAHRWNYVPQPVTSLRRRVQDNAPAASYWWRRVLDGCRGERSLQRTAALLQHYWHQCLSVLQGEKTRI